MTELVSYQRDGGVGIVTLNRPEKRNAMTAGMISSFMRMVNSAGKDDDVNALVITGAGGSFCAGVDLLEVFDKSKGDPGLPESPADREHWWPAVECRVPVIAAVDGLAVGMGAEITCQCDIRLATPTAKFAWNFARRGLVPDSGAGTWLLPRLIGVQKALRLLYTGEWLVASDALTCGYVDSVVEQGRLMEEAVRLAQSICRSAPFATRRIKRLVYSGLEAARDDHVMQSKLDLEACFQSNDHREGIAAFLEKRDPRFTGT